MSEHAIREYLKTIGEVDIDALVDVLYPVGSYYHTSDADFDPNDVWGGEWSLLGEGQVLLSGSESGDYQVGNQYGSNTHTITLNEMPSHNHNQKTLTGGFQSRHYGTGTATGAQLLFAPNGIVDVEAHTGTLGKVNIGGAGNTGGYEQVTINATHTHDTQGGGQAMDMMQLSTATFIWHRTA